MTTAVMRAATGTNAASAKLPMEIHRKQQAIIEGGSASQLKPKEYQRQNEMNAITNNKGKPIRPSQNNRAGVHRDLTISVGAFITVKPRKTLNPLCQKIKTAVTCCRMYRMGPLLFGQRI
jgi:hypothetical protein